MIISPLSDSVIEKILEGNAKLFHAVELHFKDEIVRLHGDTGVIVINGETYFGMGALGKVSGQRETMGAKEALSVELTLSGLSADLMQHINVDGCRGRHGKLMLVAIGQDGSMAVDILISGRMDAGKTSVGGNDAENSITVPLVSRLDEWNKKGTARWTDESHKARNEGDRIFHAVAQLANWSIFWGAKKDAPSFNYD